MANTSEEHHTLTVRIDGEAKAMLDRYTEKMRRDARKGTQVSQSDAIRVALQHGLNDLLRAR